MGSSFRGGSKRIAVVYTRVELYTGWGMEDYWKCSVCSALVEDVEVHSAWHRKEGVDV